MVRCVCVCVCVCVSHSPCKSVCGSVLVWRQLRRSVTPPWTQSHFLPDLAPTRPAAYLCQNEAGCSPGLTNGVLKPGLLSSFYLLDYLLVPAVGLSWCDSSDQSLGKRLCCTVLSFVLRKGKWIQLVGIWVFAPLRDFKGKKPGIVLKLSACTALGLVNSCGQTAAFCRKCTAHILANVQVFATFFFFYFFLLALLILTFGVYSLQMVV